MQILYLFVFTPRPSPNTLTSNMNHDQINQKDQSLCPRVCGVWSAWCSREPGRAGAWSVDPRGGSALSTCELARSSLVSLPPPSRLALGSSTLRLPFSLISHVSLSLAVSPCSVCLSTTCTALLRLSEASERLSLGEVRRRYHTFPR